MVAYKHQQAQRRVRLLKKTKSGTSTDEELTEMKDIYHTTKRKLKRAKNDSNKKQCQEVRHYLENYIWDN